MEKQVPLSGLNLAELLRQGAAEDTFAEFATTAFPLPQIEEIAAALPQFEILELIGQGVMGAVYKVRQKDLDRIVALKSCRSPSASTRSFPNASTARRGRWRSSTTPVSSPSI